MDDWNEPRLVLALSRSGSLVGAAKALGVDHSTAFRRLQALEARLGLKLFERTAAGAYRATNEGATMAAAAERMEDAALSLERELAGRGRSIAGRLRVTASETFAFRLLTRHVARLRKLHPGIRIELVVDSRVLNLARREAEVAFRVTRPRESDLWGRKLADVAWAIYGRTEDLAASPLADAAQLADRPVISWDDSATGIAAAEWLAARVPDHAVVYRTSSVLNQLVAASQGIGLAVLPCYLGDVEPGLARALPEPLAELRTELWMVTHKDLRATARVRALFDVVGDGIAADRVLIEGRAAAHDSVA